MSVVDGEFQGHRPTHAVAEHVRAIDSEVIEQRDHITGKCRRGDRPLGTDQVEVPGLNDGPRVIGRSLAN